MDTQLFTIGLLTLFSAMLPGADFALVTRNTLFHSRQSGILTSLGVGCAVLIHISYCALGLAIIISHSHFLFNIIKYLGACYLIYLGINSFFYKKSNRAHSSDFLKKKTLSSFISFRQGFLCNLLNPKATLFFLALFTLVIMPETPIFWLGMYAIEMFLIITGWFLCLTWILSHPRVTFFLEKAEKYIAKGLGILLIGFGTALLF